MDKLTLASVIGVKYIDVRRS